MPEYNVTAIIQAEDLNYEEKARVKQLLVPIYPELERVSILAPLMAATQEAARDMPVPPRCIADQGIIGDERLAITGGPCHRWRGIASHPGLAEGVYG